MSLKSAIVRQFGKPKGPVGHLAGHIMARRASNRLRNRRTVELMDLDSKTRVLEIGCGPGLALHHCAEIVTQGRLVGLDHSPVMIAQSHRRLRTAAVADRVELILGGVEKLADQQACFDRIYSLNVIQFVSDKHGFFGAVHRLLAPTGRVLTTYQPRLDNDAIDAAQQMADVLKDVLAATGFHGIDILDMDMGRAKAICVVAER